jgi:hypothetical protein
VLDLRNGISNVRRGSKLFERPIQKQTPSLFNQSPKASRREPNQTLQTSRAEPATPPSFLATTASVSVGLLEQEVERREAQAGHVELAAVRRAPAGRKHEGLAAQVLRQTLPLD